MKRQRAAVTGKQKRLGPLSIAARLTLLYALSAFAMLAAASGLLLWVLASSLDREDTEFISDKVEGLRAQLVAKPQDDALFREEAPPGQATPRFPQFYLRLLNSSGQTERETPGMDALLPPQRFPPPDAAAQTENGPAQLRAVNGKTYWLSSMWLKPGAAREGQPVVQIALNRTDDEVLLAEYRRMMVFVLAGGLLASAGLGYGVARRGLRPIAQMTTIAQEIRVPNLRVRVAADGWPGELQTFAATFDTLLERLDDSFARISRFSADIAHELRGPLNNLRGEAEVALSRTRSAEEYRQVIESSVEECERLSRLIDSLLFLARAESPEALVTRAVFDARAEAEAIIAFHEAVAEEKEIRLRCEGAALLSADALLFRRALSNLLSNALQYTPCGGEIVVTLCQTAEGGATISVTDNGAGIAPEHLPYLFDRFYRADAARSHYPQGTGLGLAIVKSILQLHGSAVTIHSEPGKETKVTLQFPLAPPT